MIRAIRAFEDPKYDYYRLTRDLGFLKAGTVFYHDTDDSVGGSPANGCLKLCWTAAGDAPGGICGGTVIFHTRFMDTDLFQKVSMTNMNMADFLPPGHYKVEVHSDGRWSVIKYGSELEGA